MEYFIKTSKVSEKEKIVECTGRLSTVSRPYSPYPSQTETFVRRWRLLLAECLFGLMLFIISVFIAKPVFLAPINTAPHKPIESAEIFAPLPNFILGYAPNIDPYNGIIAKASLKLQTPFMSGETEQELNDQLYQLSKGTPLNYHIVWIIFKPKYGNMWQFSIRSTDRARDVTEEINKSGNASSIDFVRIQVAISQAILESVVQPGTKLHFELSLRAMPVSPLMQGGAVRIAISGILLCYTLALIPPVIETQALVVHETNTRFKRALLIRNVSYSAVYVAWLVYAYLTVLPICVIGAIVLIMIFRWIHLLYALMTLMSYVSVMIMLSLILAVFHNTALIACLWSTLFTLLQTFLAEVIVQHGSDSGEGALSFLLHVILPPLGLIHGFNQFALLQTGQTGRDERNSAIYTVLLWTIMNLLYFAVLMLLQRTVGQERAIGGQVSWKSIIFKKVEDENALRPIETPTGKERENLQEVDELVAKAISFRNVSKSIMNSKVLNKITLDIYRGEYTMIFIERIQTRTANAIEDLLAGLAFPDEGTINVLGKIVSPSSHLMSVPNMMGYCHRSRFLVDDLTVLEHLNLFIQLCLWNESNHFVTQYSAIRLKRLLKECDLNRIKHEYIENLDMYYRAQLCWAIALLLEPKIVIVPNFTDSPNYVAVIKDKIMQYNKYITIVKISHASIQMEYADRVFVFDTKILVFGGTPAYMFFKYGRDYRIRMTFRGGGTFHNERVSEFLDNAATLGATIRANFGSLIILRLPVSPTAKVAALVKDIHEKTTYYGVTSFSISLPDTEEVTRRAINDVRALRPAPVTRPLTNQALKSISEPDPWVRNQSLCCSATSLRWIGWKYLSFFVHYRFYFIVTAIAAITAGILIGLSLSRMLSHLERDRTAMKMIHGEILTVEALGQSTNLMVRTENSPVARSIAAFYVLSETNSTKAQIKDITYTALMRNESMTEYLVTRAIDSPKHYVYAYAYGIHVTTTSGILSIEALYSPFHKDKSAASRSLARVYMALIRHYTNTSDASIQISDEPLSLDFTPFLKYADRPPLLIQFLLIVTVSHVTLIPSKEHGLIRHMQCHAPNFSPLQYWLTLYFCDLILYWFLVGFIAVAVVGIMFLTTPLSHFRYSDLLVIPFMLVIYGMSCVPQAYLFSRGPRAALNALTFIIVNIIFGEATVVAKLFYNFESTVLYLMRMWPQFNMGYALVKIKQIFLYNSECVIFKNKKLCSAQTLHKCCEKCGILQQCYKDRHYLTTTYGILNEVTAMLTMAVVFLMLIIFWEYKLIQQTWHFITGLFKDSEKVEPSHVAEGLMREKTEVHDKLNEIKGGRSEQQKVSTFGESLLCSNVTKKEMGEYVLRHIYFGIGRGEALALSGLKRHGRVQLAEMVAGLSMPSSGQLWTKGAYCLNTEPHQYCRHTSLASLRDPLPLWMTVFDALELLAILRGVPKNYVTKEIWRFIYALELYDLADTLICRVPPHERTRINFAAAVIGAPLVIIVDECTTYQNYSVCRAMYYILYQLKKRGHAIYISSHSIESHMPITNRLGILLDGRLYDVDLVDNLIARYSSKGFTVVVHLKDEVNVEAMFSRHFKKFVINDTTDVLVNVQILDTDLKWVTIFEKMEELQAVNSQLVYSYIVTSIPIDYIYNSIIVNEMGNVTTGDLFSCDFLKRLFSAKRKIQPTQDMLDNLIPFQSKYEITRLKELPWSVLLCVIISALTYQDNSNEAKHDGFIFFQVPMAAFRLHHQISSMVA